MKDRISQLMDGELDDRSADDTIKACRQGAEALEAWRTYHLIGDAMRDTRVLSAGFAARVAKRLATEPPGRAPGRSEAPQEPRKWYALPAAAAAAFAGIGLVGWLALTPQSQVHQPAP